MSRQLDKVKSRKQVNIEKYSQLFAIVILALFIFTPLNYHFKKPKANLNLNIFSRQPVLFCGVVEPLDSVAKISLHYIQRQIEVESIGGEHISPIFWLAELISNSPQSDIRAIFSIGNSGQLQTINRDFEQRKFLSYNDLRSHLDLIRNIASKTMKEYDKSRSEFQQEVLRLYSSIILYEGLKRSLLFYGYDDSGEKSQLMVEGIVDFYQATKNADLGYPYDLRDLNLVKDFTEKYLFVDEPPIVYPIPQIDRNDTRNIEWVSFGDSIIDSVNTGEVNIVAELYALEVSSFQGSDSEGFNISARDLYDRLVKFHATLMPITNIKYYLNRLLFPFKIACIYSIVCVLATVSIKLPSTKFKRIVVKLFIIVFITHTVCLILSLFTTRWFLFNLYSSWGIASWSVAFLGILFEWLYRNGKGSGISALCAGAILWASQTIGSGDSFVERSILLLVQ